MRNINNDFDEYGNFTESESDEEKEDKKEKDKKEKDKKKIKKKDTVL